MPVDLIVRHRCNKCGVELCAIASVNVEEYPIVMEMFGVKAPPPGWTAKGYEAICPDCQPKSGIVIPLPHIGGNRNN